MAKKPRYVGTLTNEAYSKADLSKVEDNSHGYSKAKVGYNDDKDKKDFLDYVENSNKKTQNEYEIKKRQQENEYLEKEKKEQPKTVSGAHSADNPDTGIGSTDKEWKNHKWVARKRGPNGKWIYDYGYGYGVKDPTLAKKQQENNSKIEALKSDNKRLQRKMDQSSGKTADSSPVEKAVNDAKKAVSDTADNVRKSAENAVGNAKKAVDDFLKRLKHTAIIGEDYLEHSDLMDISTAITNSIDDEDLYHYGIKGQQWGRRRYQNPDKSLTEEGRIHYGIGQRRANRKLQEQHSKVKSAEKEHSTNSAKQKKYYDAWDKATTEELEAMKTRDAAYKKYSDYAEKNKVFHPDYDGPMYKSEEDFRKGNVDKKGTSIHDEYVKTEDNLYKAERKSYRTFDKMVEYEDKTNESKQVLDSENAKFKKMSDKYIKKYGKVSLDSLGLS